MAYWGLALAIGPNPNSRYFPMPDDPQGEGRRAIEQALTLRQGVTEKERAFIDALAERYGNRDQSNREQRDKRYMELMQSLFQRYPDDPEAGTLYADSLMTMIAWFYWGPDGRPYAETVKAATALEQVVKQFPQHPGANHLYIHLLENSQTPEKALPHANRLASLMPGADHIVHMPTHIYVRVGQYEQVVINNRQSVAADMALLKVWGSRVHPNNVPSGGASATTHASHARDMILLAAQFQGRYALAMEAAQALMVPVEQLNGNGTAQARYVKKWLMLRRFGKWQEILQETAPSKSPPFVQGMWHFVRGSALTGVNRLDAAESELERVLQIKNSEAAEKIRVRVNSARTLLTIASELLAGEIAESKGEIEKALAHLETAIRIEDGLNYIEPPDWGHPGRHYLGAVLLQAGRPAEAEVVYWEDLRRNPENGWSLFGLLKSLRDQGKRNDAARIEERFNKAWASADVKPESSKF
jgi:tetratricopeptide (TPR) repeat protein